MRSVLKFRLYVAGDGPNSLQAIANLNALCKQRLPGRHAIEIVDVFREPQRALTDGILLTPTLLKLSPTPVRKVVGTLSESEQLARILEL
jgi:circadian clock protein KaiB